MPTLIASPTGLERIRQARCEQGWGWSTDDDDGCLLIASRIIDDSRSYEPGGPYANGISGGTWKRFLAGRHPIRASAFKAYCQALGLNWQDVIARDTLVQTVPSPTVGFQDWGEAPEISSFLGRSQELSRFKSSMEIDRCRLIGVSGMAGIGKTAVVVKAAEAAQSQFEALIYRSLQSAPPLAELLSELIDVLGSSVEKEAVCETAAKEPPMQEAEPRDVSLRDVSPIPSPSNHDSIDSQLSVLMDYLRDRRCLLILDDGETVLQGGELVGQYLPGYEGYGSFLRRVGTERHQSCLVLISREQPREVSAFASAGNPVRELNLKGMSIEDGRAFLESTGLVKRGSNFDVLIQRYRGNPSALRVVSKIVREFFGGDVIQFMSQSTVFVTDVLTELLAQQMGRLSMLEGEVMYWLAIACQPVSLSELKGKLWRAVSTTELLNALQSLQRRSLIEKDPSAEGSEAIFTLQPVVMKFVTTQFIHRTCQDIQRLIKTETLDQLGLLKTHALVSDRGDPDDLQQIQVRTILNRVCDRLYETIHPNQVKATLQELIVTAQGQPWQVIGYGEQNMKTLLTAPFDGRMDGRI